MKGPHMSQTTLATAADYADAMITARRAKTWLFVILLILILVQLALFFVAKYADDVVPRAAAGAVATTQPELADSRLALAIEYVIGLSVFFGIALILVLGVVLLLIVTIMLVGRLIGVSKVTSAFIWCAVLAVLLFPWQAFLNYPALGEAPYRLPGVLYTWAELVRDVHFDDRLPMDVVLKWARFVGFPILALILLLSIQVKSNRGLRLALGEAEPAPTGLADQSLPNV